MLFFILELEAAGNAQTGPVRQVAGSLWNRSFHYNKVSQPLTQLTLGDP